VTLVFHGDCNKGRGEMGGSRHLMVMATRGEVEWKKSILPSSSTQHPDSHLHGSRFPCDDEMASSRCYSHGRDRVIGGRGYRFRHLHPTHHSWRASSTYILQQRGCGSFMACARKGGVKHGRRTVVSPSWLYRAVLSKRMKRSTHIKSSCPPGPPSNSADDVHMGGMLRQCRRGSECVSITATAMMRYKESLG